VGRIAIHQYIRGEPPMGNLSNYMIKSVKKTGPEITLKEAATIMKKDRITSLMIVEGETPLGIITESDLALRAILGGYDPSTTKVSELMSTSLKTILLGDTVQEANDIMRMSHIRHLPVLDDGKIVGLITMVGLLRYYMDLAKQQNQP